VQARLEEDAAVAVLDEEHGRRHLHGRPHSLHVREHALVEREEAANTCSRVAPRYGAVAFFRLLDLPEEAGAVS